MISFQDQRQILADALQHDRHIHMVYVEISKDLHLNQAPDFSRLERILIDAEFLLSEWERNFRIARKAKWFKNKVVENYFQYPMRETFLIMSNTLIWVRKELTLGRIPALKGNQSQFLNHDSSGFKLEHAQKLASLIQEFPA